MKQYGNKSYFDLDRVNEVYNQVNRYVIQPYNIIKSSADINNWDEFEIKNQWSHHLQSYGLSEEISPFTSNYENFLDGMSSLSNRKDFYDSYKSLINTWKIKYDSDEYVNVDTFDKFNYLLMPGNLEFKWDSEGNIQHNERPLTERTLEYDFLDNELRRSYQSMTVLDKLYNGGLNKPSWHDDLIQHLETKEGISGFNIDGVPFLQTDEYKEWKGLGITPRDYYNWTYRAHVEYFKNMIHGSDSPEMIDAYKNVSVQNLEAIRAAFGDAMYYVLLNLDIEKRNNMIIMLNAINEEGLFTQKKAKEISNQPMEGTYSIIPGMYGEGEIIPIPGDKIKEGKPPSLSDADLDLIYKHINKDAPQTEVGEVTHRVRDDGSDNGKLTDSDVYFYKDGTFNNYRLFVDLGLLREVDIKKTLLHTFNANMGISSYKTFTDCVTGCHYDAGGPGGGPEFFYNGDIDWEIRDDGLNKFNKTNVIKNYSHLWKDALGLMGNTSGVPRNDAEWEIAWDMLYLEILHKERLDDSDESMKAYYEGPQGKITPEFLLMYLKHKDNPVFSSYFDERTSGIEEAELNNRANEFLAYLVSGNMSSLDRNTFNQVLTGGRREDVENTMFISGDKSNPLKNFIVLDDLRYGSVDKGFVEQFISAKDSKQNVSEDIINQIIENKIPTFELKFAEHIAGSRSNNPTYLEIDGAGRVTKPGYGTDALLGNHPDTDVFGNIEGFAPYTAFKNEEYSYGSGHPNVPSSEVNMIKANVGVVRLDFNGNWVVVDDSRVINTFKEGRDIDASYHFFDEMALEGYASALNPNQIDAYTDRIDLENQGYRLVNLENGEIIPPVKEILRQSYAMSYYWDEHREKLWNLLELNKLQRTSVEQFNNSFIPDSPFYDTSRRGELGPYSQSDLLRDRTAPVIDGLFSATTLGLKDLIMYAGGWDSGKVSDVQELELIAKVLDLNSESPELSTLAQREVGMSNYYNTVNSAADVANHFVGFIGGAKVWTGTVNKFWNPARNSLGGYINSGLMFSTVGTGLKLTDPDMSPLMEGDKDYISPSNRYSASDIAFGASLEFIMGSMFHGLNKVGFKPKLSKTQRAAYKADGWSTEKINAFEESLLNQANKVWGGRGAVVVQPDQKRMLANLFMQGTAGGTMMHGLGAAEHCISLLSDGLSWNEALQSTFDEFGFTEQGVENFFTNITFMTVLHSLNAFPKNLHSYDVNVENFKFKSRESKRTYNKDKDVYAEGTHHQGELMSKLNLKEVEIGTLWNSANRNAFNRLSYQTERFVNKYLSGEINSEFGFLKNTKNIPEWLLKETSDPSINIKKIEWLMKNDNFKAAYVSEQIEILKEFEGHWVINAKGEPIQLTSDYIKAFTKEVKDLHLANLNNFTYYNSARLIRLREDLANFTYHGYQNKEFMKQLKANYPEEYKKIMKEVPLLNKENVK
tara:strand:- start:1928 stop:6223 length:4296 start_codon:yes stop_codon:yes gene_type:complete